MEEGEGEERRRQSHLDDPGLCSIHADNNLMMLQRKKEGSWHVLGASRCSNPKVW